MNGLTAFLQTVAACDDKGIEGNKYLLGSYTNLKRLVQLPSQDHIFDPAKQYDNEEGIADKSTDLAVCSLALDFATTEEKKEFFSENKRILKYGGYLMLLAPITKMEESCRDSFLKDLEDIGFQVDEQLTGTYKSRRTLDVDTSEYKSNGFQSYVIIARKIDNQEIDYKEGRTYFTMMNDYKIVEGPTIQPLGGGGKDKRVRRYECSGFYNSDNKIDPTQLTPGDATPLPPEVNEFMDTIESARQSDLDELADILNRLGGDD